jgi:hypothetical protein
MPIKPPRYQSPKNQKTAPKLARQRAQLSIAAAINSPPRAFQLTTLPARASHPPTRALRYQPCRYKSRSSQLPPRTINLATRSYLPRYQISPYPNWNIPLTYRPAPTISRLPARADELVATDSQLSPRSYRLPSPSGPDATISRPPPGPAATRRYQIATRRYHLGRTTRPRPPRAYRFVPTSSSLASSIPRFVSNCSSALHCRPAGIRCRLADRDAPIPESKPWREYIPVCFAPHYSPH